MQGDAQQPADKLIEELEYAVLAHSQGLDPYRKHLPAAKEALRSALLAAQAQPQVPDGCRNVTAAEDRFLHRAVRESSTFVAAGKLAAPPVPAQAAPSMEAPTVEAGPWKAANEFLPYHPSASHVRPAYRDGWNACWRAMQATHPTTAAPAGVPSEIELIAQQWDGCMYDAGPGGDIDIGKAIRLAARASSPSGASQEALTGSKLREAAAFLLGEAALDGVWFGDPHPTEKGAFWWRKHLRAAMEQQHAQEQEGTNHGTS